MPEQPRRDTTPLEQRKAVRSETRNVRETRRCGLEFELREVPSGTGTSDLQFTGFASVTDQAYEMSDWLGGFNETVSKGAFKKTLDEGADVAFLLQHEGMTLSRTKSGTMKLSEQIDGDVTGLYVDARLDPVNPTVAAMRSAIERGDLDEMSFAFRVVRQKWVWADESGAEMDERYIQEVNMNQGDVSLVNYGANPHTGGLVAIRKNGAVNARGVVAAFRELREGKTLSSASMQTLQAVLNGINDADTAIDQALVDLSSFMGIANPDVDDADDSQSGSGSGDDAGEDTETQAAKLDVEIAVALARAREAEKKRRKAA